MPGALMPAAGHSGLCLRGAGQFVRRAGRSARSAERDAAGADPGGGQPGRLGLGRRGAGRAGAARAAGVSTAAACGGVFCVLQLLHLLRWPLICTPDAGTCPTCRTAYRTACLQVQLHRAVGGGGARSGCGGDAGPLQRALRPGPRPGGSLIEFLKPSVCGPLMFAWGGWTPALQAARAAPWTRRAGTWGHSMPTTHLPPSRGAQN